MSDADRARALRRRHMHERQAVIFGVLLAALAVVGLGSAAVYTGSLSLPFMEQEFEAEPTPSATTRSYPCPPDGALPVAYGEVTVNVYNSTSTAGLAAATLKAFTDRGFVGGEADNQPTYAGTVRIAFGQSGIASAYTVAAHVPKAEFVLDGRKGPEIDVVLGTEFKALVPADEVGLDPEKPLEAPKGCTKVPAAGATSAAPKS
ncbi:LytR C-terminal domain-containing protein [Cellulomonas palmilytica]|uniref:LytR C-terminal domain-containing protein n=1 Tax=Cellulomonas palmilytica TaxID=2608402 RepID=UPI001F466DF7|nr:LytR C-terminal domain-containing protein [Cellulomonas palmilytica]UJP40195.1 LytR C-terminal domain-containing protein [Cellulomonas palmilytica]